MVVNDRERREETVENTIEGRNIVFEALKAERTIEKIFIAKQTETARFPGHILMLAKEKGIPVVEVERRKLDLMSNTHNHQGVIAVISDKEYVTIDQILSLAKEKNEPPFIILCDHLSDTYNLGAVIRTAFIAGAHGLILPKRRSATLNAAVYKASAGAAEHLPICKVANITAAITELKEKGLWVFGADAGGTQSMYKADFKGATALVIGSEDAGVSQLVLKNCDVVVSIPMKNAFNSLNASAAAAVLMYEVLRQRGGDCIG